jgi:hypothetical protein
VKAEKIILEFWTYEITGVQLNPDIWIHYKNELGEQHATRVMPTTALRSEAISEAETLAKLLGLALEVKDTAIPPTQAEKELIASGVAV